MAKKMTRLLSLLLAVIMIASMATIVTTAQYEYDEAATNSTLYTKNIPYDELAGKEYQNKRGVYVVDDAWSFKKGEEPETVSYYFRGKTYTEDYDATRHLSTVAAMYTQAKADGVTLPTCILTAGNYSTAISLTDSVILLGANAGINPNLPDADPTKEWKLNSKRFLPDMTSEKYGTDDDMVQETRIWAGVELCETPRVAGNTLKLFSVANSADVARTFVVDGLVFQGYGASFADTSNSSSSGSHTFYIQNVIMNDNSAYDVSPIRMWGRGSTNTMSKKVYFSNSYVTGNDAMYFYSGHADTLHLNGVSYQNSSQSFIYNIMTMQWIGMDFSMTNCHLWNSEYFATSKVSTSMYWVRAPYTSTSQAEAGTNTEPFRYNISNNTFYNMTAMNADGTTRSTTSPFVFYMASEDEMVKIENNIIMSSFNVQDGQNRSPILISYNKIEDGTISRASTGTVGSTTTANYELSDRNLSIKNNILTEEYWGSINIGNNTCPDTLVTTEGNLYTEKYDGENVMTGVIPAAAADNNYSKWVWLEYDPKGANDDLTKRSDYIDIDAVQINGEVKEKTITADVASDVTTYDVTMSCNTSIHAQTKLPLNSVKIYAADEAFNKGAEVAANEGVYSLSTEERKNNYVLSVVSMDGRSSYDYNLTINRAIKVGSVLNGIVDQANKTETQDTTVDYFNYEVNYANKTFDFTLDVPAGATATLTDAEGYLVEPTATNTYSIPLNEVATAYDFDVVVASADGVEKYDLSLLRRMNERTELAVDTTSGTATQNGTTWNVALGANDLAVDFGLNLSENATVEIVDPIYKAPLAVKNGVYSLENIPVGNSVYTATVTAQNSVDTQEWTVVFNRPARSAAKLNSVKNATLNNGVYTATTSGNRFMISTDYNFADGATLAIYSDAACTQKITNANLTLTALTTNVWIKVTAEDGVTSDVKQLTVKTTTLATDEGVYYAPMAGNGVIEVSGATKFTDDTITVELPDGTKEFHLVVNGLNGHRVRIYTDDKASLLTVAEQDIKLDAGVTRLYAEAIKDGVVKPYLIEIKASQYYSFTDTAVDWAKDYVEKLGTSGLAIMKGDEHMKFNGANNLTRYEMAIMMVRVAGINKDLYSKLSLTFTDTADIPDWAADYVKAAYKYGMIGGYGVYEGEELVGYEFLGKNNATRSEFLKVFMNAVTGDADKFYEDNKDAINKKVEKKNFADIKVVEEWAIPYVYSAIYKDVIKGDADKMINPEDLITRNEVAAILGRYLCGMK